MKYIASVLLCVTLVMSMVCLGVSAAPSQSATFTVSANDAKVGETVNVVVSITENSYFTNAIIYMHYDSAVMEYVTDSLGAAASRSAMYMSNNFADRNYVKMAYVAINGIKKGGELFVFEFKVLSETATQFNVSFDECVGADENNTTFDVNYTVVPCVVNGHNNAPIPTKTTVTAKPPVTTKAPNTTKAPVITQKPATTRPTSAPVTKVDPVTTKTTKTQTQPTVSTHAVVPATTENDTKVTSTTAYDGDETTLATGTTSTAVKDSQSTAVNGLVSVTTTVTTAVTNISGLEENTSQDGNNWLVVLLIVIGVAALVAVGAVVIAKKRRC